MCLCVGEGLQQMDGKGTKRKKKIKDHKRKIGIHGKRNKTEKLNKKGIKGIK